MSVKFHISNTLAAKDPLKPIQYQPIAINSIEGKDMAHRVDY